MRRHAVVALLMLGGAWIFWVEATWFPSDGLAPQWSIFRAFRSEAACQGALRELLDAAGKSPDVERVSGQLIYYKALGDSRMRERYLCLPETVDPRGPKR